MASKLIVNEIEHTDGSGTAVTMAKATITDLTSGTLGSGVTGGSGLTALGTVTAGNLSNTAIVYPAGHILQVKYAGKDDTFDTNSSVGTFVDITGLSITITPKSSSNKILLTASVSCGHQADYGHSYLALARGGTLIGVGASAGNRTGGGAVINNTFTGEQAIYTLIFYDSPATTSATTYTVKGCSSARLYINRSHRDNDGASFDGRTYSSLTAMEVVV